MLHHYLVVDLWDNMWSNIMAPSAATLVAVIWSHIRIRQHQHKNHAEHMAALKTLIPKADAEKQA